MSFETIEKDIVSDVESINPAAIVANLQTDLEDAKTRIGSLETLLASFVTSVQQFVPLIEAAIPSATPEITAALTAIKSLTPPAPTVAIVAKS